MVWLSAVTFSKIESFNQLQVWFNATTKKEIKKGRKKLDDGRWSCPENPGTVPWQRVVAPERFLQIFYLNTGGAWKEKPLEFSFPEMRFHRKPKCLRIWHGKKTLWKKCKRHKEATGRRSIFDNSFVCMTMLNAPMIILAWAIIQCMQVNQALCQVRVQL